MATRLNTKKAASQKEAASILFYVVCLGALNQNETIVTAGHCTLEKEQIAVGVDALNRQPLGRNTLVAHLTGHLLTLPNFTGRGALTNGTWT